MIFDVIPIGSRIIGGFIGRNKKKSCIILIIILENTYKMVHYESSYRCFLLEIFGMSEKVPIYVYEK